jgi:hypothetical protein
MLALALLLAAAVMPALSAAAPEHRPLGALAACTAAAFCICVFVRRQLYVLRRRVAEEAAAAAGGGGAADT